MNNQTFNGGPVVNILRLESRAAGSIPVSPGRCMSLSCVVNFPVTIRLLYSVISTWIYVYYNAIMSSTFIKQVI